MPFGPRPIQKSHGLGLLRSKSSLSACYNRGLHVSSNKLDTDAYGAVIGDILSWIRDPATTKPVIWMNGAASTGKSTVALSVAEKCQEEGLLAAIFVFSDGDPSRNDLDHFVPTVANQIATAFPIIGEKINRVVSQEPLLLNRAVRTQWERLIIGASHTEPPQRRSVIIVDGLDGCRNRTPGALDPSSHQQQLLGLIWLAAQIPSFPFCFLITSRPEPTITDIMTSIKWKPLVHKSITLGDAPILPKGIRGVTLRNLLKRGERYPLDLPPGGVHPLLEELVDWMVRETRGKWVFVTTVFREIDQMGGDPYQRIDEIRRSFEVRSASLEPLDHLYTTILVPALEAGNNFTTELLLFIANHKFDSTPSLSCTAQWFGVDTFDVRLALRNLQSVIDIPQDDHGQIQFYDKTFHDFLLDPTRHYASGLDLHKGFYRLSRWCLAVLRSANIKSEDFRLASFSWMSYCSRASRSDLLREDLTMFKFGGWMDFWSAQGNVEDLFTLVRDYPLFLNWLNEWESPPTQFRPDALDNLRRKFLAKLAQDDRGAIVRWLGLLAVTVPDTNLDWDGFQSLYHNLDLAAIPSFLRNCDYSQAWLAFDFDFLSDHNRAREFCIDVGKAKEDLWRACISSLARGEGATDGERNAFTYAETHQPVARSSNNPFRSTEPTEPTEPTESTGISVPSSDSKSIISHTTHRPLPIPDIPDEKPPPYSRKPDEYDGEKTLKVGPSHPFERLPNSQPSRSSPGLQGTGRSNTFSASPRPSTAPSVHSGRSISSSQSFSAKASVYPGKFVSLSGPGDRTPLRPLPSPYPPHTKAATSSKVPMHDTTHPASDFARDFYAAGPGTHIPLTSASGSSISEHPHSAPVYGTPPQFPSSSTLPYAPHPRIGGYTHTPPPPPPPTPSSRLHYMPTYAPAPPLVVYKAGDPRLGGRLCWKCEGYGTVSFLFFDQTQCKTCGGTGRVFW